MQPELEEFAQIVNGGWPGGDMPKRPTNEELKKALKTLLVRQCVFANTPQIGRTWEIARHYAPFFERFFACLDYRFVFSARDQMAALAAPLDLPRPDATRQRLRKEQIIVLLALRLLWEEAMSAQDVTDHGVAEITTGDLLDRIKAVTGDNPPDEPRLVEILRLFNHHGAIKIGERDRIERVMPLSVTPGVAVLVPDAFVDSLKDWAASSPANDDLPEIDLSSFG